jgi:hypothetical protein
MPVMADYVSCSITGLESPSLVIPPAKPITLLCVSVVTHTPAHCTVSPIDFCASLLPCSKAAASLIPLTLVGRHILLPPRRHHAPLDKWWGVLLCSSLPRLRTRRFRRDLPPRAREGAVNFWVFLLRAMPAGLLQRPGDRAISGSIGFGVHELFLVRVEEGRNVALGGFPPEFPVECGD